MHLYLRAVLTVALARWGLAVLHRQIWCGQGDTCTHFTGECWVSEPWGASVCKHAPPPLPSLPQCVVCPGALASHLSAQPSLMFLFAAVNVTWVPLWYFPQAVLYSPTFSGGLRLVFHVFLYLLHVRQAFSYPFTQPCPWILSSICKNAFPSFIFFLLPTQHFGGLCLFTLIRANQEFMAL